MSVSSRRTCYLKVGNGLFVYNHGNLQQES